MVSGPQSNDVFDPLTTSDWPSIVAVTSHPVVVTVNWCHNVSSMDREMATLKSEIYSNKLNNMKRVDFNAGHWKKTSLYNMFIYRV